MPTSSSLKSKGFITKCQSGFTEGDCTINQILEICSIFYQNLDHSDEILAVQCI